MQYQCDAFVTAVEDDNQMIVNGLAHSEFANSLSHTQLATQTKSHVASALESLLSSRPFNDGLGV